MIEGQLLSSSFGRLLRDSIRIAGGLSVIAVQVARDSSVGKKLVQRDLGAAAWTAASEAASTLRLSSGTVVEIPDGGHVSSVDVSPTTIEPVGGRLSESSDQPSAEPSDLRCSPPTTVVSEQQSTITTQVLESPSRTADPCVPDGGRQVPEEILRASSAQEPYPTVSATLPVRPDNERESSTLLLSPDSSKHPTLSASLAQDNHSNFSGRKTTQATSRKIPAERKVPATPMSRVIGFAGLGASLAFGTLQESARRMWQGSGQNESSASLPGSAYGSSPFLTEGNAERLAAALCRMRGAALKLGQMLSIQDERMIPPQILAALERVRQGADTMPRGQLENVLRAELGIQWEREFTEFDFTPMAAASIGQVHSALLPSGLRVAVKVQYPGVARSIHSDVDNLATLLSFTNLLPKQLYLEQAMKVAKEELTLECDYSLEARNQTRFQQLIEQQQSESGGRWDLARLSVPRVVGHLSTERVLTTEMAKGVPIDHLAKSSQNVRNRLASTILHLTLHELFELRFMQTDPNWGNFLYDADSDTLSLIDFGAARDYPKAFVDDYLRMVRACSDRDRSTVLHMSQRLGFLTGEETRLMLDAHTEAAFAVGLPFSRPGGYDFGSTGVTQRVTELGATMVRHRLTPPPEDAYSLHRKLSGSFLACMKLRATVPCREMLLDVWERYKFD